MRKLKYIVFKGVLDMESIVFPDTVSHDVMAYKVGIRDNSNILGAGFVEFVSCNGKLKAECFGNSVSLKVDSRPLDDSLRVTVDYFGLNYEIKEVK